MSLHDMLLDKLRDILKHGHEPKVPDQYEMRWEPMGVRPLMMIGDGMNRNFCPDPRDMKFNPADCIRRQLFGSRSEGDDDPWRAARADDPFWKEYYGE